MKNIITKRDSVSRILLKTFLLTLFFLTINYASDKKVLVEVMTNSHCPLCPPAHNAIDAYLQNSPNASKINFIYYHMVFPYSDDQLNLANPQDAAGRNSYYGPFSQTPVGFFDGIQQGGNYSSWSAALDALLAGQSPLEISLSGNKINSNQFSITANIKQTENISESDLKIYFVVAENVNYTGRNGISNHKHVMRKMITSPTGELFTISLNEAKDLTKVINIDNNWNAGNLSVIVFVQSAATKKVFQSGTINYSDLTVTSVEDENILPLEFNLSQNYPNPFNPSTKIKYTIPTSPLAKGRNEVGFVTLKVYDILGNDVSTLVNKVQPAGNYEVEFSTVETHLPAGRQGSDASLPSGIYFYQLTVDNGQFSSVKKMILLK